MRSLKDQVHPQQNCYTVVELFHINLQLMVFCLINTVKCSKKVLDLNTGTFSPTNIHHKLLSYKIYLKQENFSLKK